MADSNMNDAMPMKSTRKNLKRKLPDDESLDLVAAANLDGTYERAKKNPELSQEEATFDFNSLPWVCQKRFAEVCDQETVKTFAKINAETRNLVKRSHTIEDVIITMNAANEISCKYFGACYCREDEYCKGINADDLSSFNGKFKVMNSITIKATKEQIIDALFLDHLPINFDSCKHLTLTAKSMNLEVLKRTMNPELKSLTFHGGIESNCSLEGFVNFIKYLSTLDRFFFVLAYLKSSLSFNSSALVQEARILRSQEVITHFFGLKVAHHQNPENNVLDFFFSKGF